MRQGASLATSPSCPNYSAREILRSFFLSALQSPALGGYFLNCRFLNCRRNLNCLSLSLVTASPVLTASALRWALHFIMGECISPQYGQSSIFDSWCLTYAF